MIVPDKKTEAFLNKKADAGDIINLCREGILSSADFLKAIALCRSERKWLNKIRLVLLFLTVLSLCSAFFFFVLSRWSFFYTLHGGVLLSVLFVVCCCFRRYAAADYIGMLIIGAMIFLPDIVFGTNVFLYEQFFLYFVLLLLWAIPSKRTGVRLLPLIALNAWIAAYGVQFLLPSFRMETSAFCALAAIMNAGLLLLREETVNRMAWGEPKAFRLLPLVLGSAFLLAGAVMQENPAGQGLSFLYCLLFTVVWGAFYFFKDRDWAVFSVLLGFCTVWVSLLLYNYIKRSGLSVESGRMLFLTAESLILMIAWTAGKLLDDWLKGKKDVG